MLLDVGRVLLGQPEGAQVRHNYRTHPRVLQGLQPLGQLLDLIAARHGVDGYVGIHAVGPAIGHRLVQLLLRKVAGKGPHPKGGAARYTASAP